MNTVTISSVLALNPCSPYATADSLQPLFGENTELTGQQVLHLDIPIHDRMWIIDAANLVPDSVRTDIINQMTSGIQNQSSDWFQRYAAQPSGFCGFGQLAHAYADQNGTDFRTEFQNLQNVVVSALTNYLG